MLLHGRMAFLIAPHLSLSSIGGIAGADEDSHPVTAKFITARLHFN